MNINEFYKKVDPAVAVAKIVFNFLKKQYPLKLIKSIATTTSGGTPSRGNTEYYGGDIPWLKSGGLNDGLVTEVKEYITEKGLKESSAKLFPKGTLLVAMYGATAGKTGILNFESSTNQAVCGVTVNTEKIERDFLFWFFRQHRLDYLKASFGGAQPNISQKTIKNTHVPVPDLKLQKSIVEFLNKIEKEKSVDMSFPLKVIFTEIESYFQHQETNNQIENNFTNQLTDLSKLRQVILQDAIQGKLLPQNPADEPAAALLDRIKSEKARLIQEKKIRKEKPLAEITAEEVPFDLPDGWVWCRLQEITSKLGSGSTPRGGKSAYTKSGVKFLRSQNIRNEGLKLDDVVFIDEKTNEKMNGTVVCPNDILLNITGGSLGRTTRIPSDFDIANVSQHVSIIRPVFSFLSDYIHYLILSDYLQKTIMSSITGAGREGLPKYRMQLFLIPLPPEKTIPKIVAKVEELLSLVNALEEQTEAQQRDAEVLMQGVLAEAFG